MNHDFELEFWRDGAACAVQTDIDFFSENAREVAKARTICGGCVVRDDCLVFALETNQTDGIWGGHTSRERVKVRRRWLEDYRRAS